VSDSLYTAGSGTIRSSTHSARWAKEVGATPVRAPESLVRKEGLPIGRSKDAGFTI
jgi:hypothetical protein